MDGLRYGFGLQLMHVSSVNILKKKKKNTDHCRSGHFSDTIVFLQVLLRLFSFLYKRVSSSTSKAIFFFNII